MTRIVPSSSVPLLLVVALAGCAAPSAEPVRPEPIPPEPVEAASPAAEADASAELAALFEAYDEAQLEMSPITKAYRGIVDEDYGRWNEISDEAAARARALDVRTQRRMRERFDPSELSGQDRLSYLLFEDMVARDSAAYEFRENEYIFDQMTGLQSFAPAFLINIHRVTDLTTAEDYVERLEGLGTFLGQAIDEAIERAGLGVLPPEWVYAYVIDDARNVITGAPFDGGEDSPLLADFKEKVAVLDLAESVEAALIADAREALLDEVGPAYRRLVQVMEEQRAVAPAGDGVWRLPRGEEYYAERLGYYTTTDLTAAEVHELGLRHVRRIHGEMRAIMDEVGFEGTLQEFFEHVRTGDRFYYDTREGYLEATRRVIERMETALPDWFDTLPQAELVVKEVEPFREKSAGKAFYQMPAPDGSRPGVYYVNLYNLDDMSMTELEALAYHEALPGHHLQLSIQTELGEVPAFRKFGGVTAYTEGWGLYAEELGKDMGFYEDPYSDFGRLGMELWRAARLVVDTGIHDKRWSRDEAMQYLRDNTPNPEGDVRKGIERYIVFPGQATAYMVGKLEILELRERARERLGDDFEIGEFHDAILLSGPVPLHVMEANVEEYIAEELERAGAAADADVTVADFAWLTGEWVGEGPGGSIAEIDYMPPEAGVLPAFFRLYDGERILVLEAVTLVDEEDGLYMYVRHFDPALVPLEAEHALRLRLVGRDGDRFFFENAYEGENPVRSMMTRTSTGFVSRSELVRPDGSTAEIRVEYRRR